MSKKELALHQALDQITFLFGKGSIMWLGRFASPGEFSVVSTGSFALDHALGTSRPPKLFCKFSFKVVTGSMLQMVGLENLKDF